MAPLRSHYNRHPWLRKMLSPVRAAYTQRKRAQYRSQAQVIDRFLGMLTCDPVLDVAEFQGQFVIGRHSSLLRKLLVSGSYELPLSRILKQIVDPARDAIDVGANIGFYSVFLSRLISGRILAFEPVQEAIERLTVNLQLNHSVDRVVICPMIASDEAALTEMSVVVGQEEYSTVGRLEHPNAAQLIPELREVRCTTVDEQVEQLGLRPGFIKIDAEGSELRVLQGSQSTLKIHRPIILTELSQRLLEANGATTDEFLKLLNALAYVPIDPLYPDLDFYTKDYGDALLVPVENRDDLVSAIRRAG